MSETIGSDDCSKMLMCTPELVEEMARLGDIPGLKIGRSWLFVKHDLLSYLAERARAEAQERRAKRQPGVREITSKPRRQVPPVLRTTS